MDRSWGGQGSGGWLPSNVDQFSYGADAAPSPGEDIPPTVFGAYRHAWEALWSRFGTLVLAAIVLVLVELPANIFGQLGPSAHGFYGMEALYSLFIAVPATYGMWYLLLRVARGEPAAVGDLFAPFQRGYWPCLTSYLLTMLCIVVGCLLLIIPGVVAAIRLAFVPFLVVDEGLGGMEALRESWRRTRGYSWRLFGVCLLAIPIALIGLLLFGVGVIPAALWIGLAVAALFAAVTARGRYAARPAAVAGW